MPDTLSRSNKIESLSSPSWGERMTPARGNSATTPHNQRGSPAANIEHAGRPQSPADAPLLSALTGKTLELSLPVPLSRTKVGGARLSVRKTDWLSAERSKNAWSSAPTVASSPRSWAASDGILAASRMEPASPFDGGTGAVWNCSL
eukprot:scaffold308095_cov32-Tisochrysis_lutea.AAC.1